MIERQTIRLRGSGLSWRAIQDQVVVLDLESSRYLSLNPTGSVLWPLLVEGTTVARMTEELMQTFDVERETARADVEAFVTSCLDQKLLDPPSGTSQ